jgi:hypothetical protein
MHKPRENHRRPFRTWVPVLTAVACVNAPAWASDPVACARHYEEGQRLRNAKQLLSATDALIACAQPDCPPAVVRDCARWLNEVRAETPSVVFAARDDTGHDLQDVTVHHGKRQIAERIDGAAVALDPGPYDLRFQASGGRLITLSVVIRQAEKNRLIDVVFHRASGSRKLEPTAPSKSAAHPPTGEPRGGSAEPRDPLPLALAGAGAVAVGSFAYFGWTARSDVNEMRDRCSPRCPDNEVDGARSRALVADISLGVGVLALTGAAALTWVWPASSSSGTAVVIKPGAIGFTGKF